jgi:endonuclease G, mitochondrial
VLTHRPCQPRSFNRHRGGTFTRVLLCIIVLLFVGLLIWQLVFNKDGKGLSWPQTPSTLTTPPATPPVDPPAKPAKPAGIPPSPSGPSIPSPGPVGTQRTATDPRFYNYSGAPRPRSDNPVEILTNKAYMVGYSDKRHNPLWVSYRVFRVTPAKAPERSDNFRVDTRTQSAVSTADYSKSGYDRGHMAPSRVIGLLYGANAQDETFLMSNIVPQKPSLNRGTWAKLEGIELEKLSIEFEEIWVTTGPIFDAKPRTFPGGVAIPSSFFKTFIDEDRGNPRAITFLIPQEVKGGENLQMFLTSVRQIENLTGLDLNPQMNKAVQEKVETAIPTELW